MFSFLVPTVYLGVFQYLDDIAGSAAVQLHCAQIALNEFVVRRVALTISETAFLKREHTDNTFGQ